MSGDNSLLSLKDLAAKLAMLLALVLAHRSSDLIRLSVVGIRCQTHAVSIQVHGLTRPNSLQSMQPVVVSSLDSNPLLCPKACLWVRDIHST